MHLHGTFFLKVYIYLVYIKIKVENVSSKITYFSSVTQSCLTLCDPMNHSTPGLPVPQHARPPCPSPTPRVHPNPRPLSWWCHPTISSSVIPFSRLNLSQHQGLFQWVSSSHPVAKVLELQLQHGSFQPIFKVDFLLDWLLCLRLFFFT